MKRAPLLCWLDIQVQHNGVTAEMREENFSLQLYITFCAPLVAPPSHHLLSHNYAIELECARGIKGLFSIIL